MVHKIAVCPYRDIKTMTIKDDVDILPTYTNHDMAISDHPFGDALSCMTILSHKFDMDS